MKTPSEVLTEWVAAFNTRDARAAAALYDERAINVQIANGSPLEGRQAILENIEAFFQAFPDTYTTVENIFECGRWGILEWSGGGTFLGPLPGLQPTGKSFKLQGCGFFHIPHGTIVFQRGYWDSKSWANQISAPVAI